MKDLVLGAGHTPPAKDGDIWGEGNLVFIRERGLAIPMTIDELLV